MGPVRGNNKKKRKADEKSELFLGSSKEGCDDWWDVLSKKIAGNPSPPGIDAFKSTLRMSKKTFEYICTLAGPHMLAKAHFVFANGKPMSLPEQVALALRRLGSGNSLVSVGDSFNAHHSTVSQATWRFVEAVEAAGLRHLQWPSKNELSKVKNGFERIRGLPNCCGAMESTNVAMQLTSSDPEAEAWLDPRGKHSMVLQAIVGPDTRFLDAVAGWPGKMKRASVLRNSGFFGLCQRGERLNGEEEYVVGGSGFLLLPWLVTPYRKGEEGLTEAEEGFNGRLAETQWVARRALARLKEEWRMLRGEMWRPDKHRLPRIILVCCVLHNILIEMEEEKDDGDDDDDDVWGPVHDEPGYEGEVCESVEREGLVLRDKLCMYFV